MTTPVGPACLDPAQQRALFQDGYVHLPGAVPLAAVHDVLAVINQSLGTEGIPRDDLPNLRARTFTPELVHAPAIGALFQGTRLEALAASAIGPGKLRVPGEGQIALRFPTVGGRHPPYPHIDGISSPENGVPAGTLYHFTALAGVFLSDAPTADQGNFVVWPGSHRLMQAHLRAHGPASLLQGFPALALPPPLALPVRAGDAVIAHYQLVHGVAPNLGPHIRYAVFFRLFHVDHQTDDTRPLVDLWHHWEGLRDLVAGAPAT